MIEICYWTSANAQKVMMFLEESGIAFRVVPLNVTQGKQFEPEFASRFPNSKIPAIVDYAPADGGEPISIFESGAILQYLAEKTEQFLAKDIRTRMHTLQWLYWQVGGLGPIGGQAVHFRNYAPQPIEYALKRYGAENDRLIGVLDTVLNGRDFISGDYSIADMACFPWIFSHNRREQVDLDQFPNVKRWFKAIGDRPATIRAYEWIPKVLEGVSLVKDASMMSVEQRRIMFGAHAV